MIHPYLLVLNKPLKLYFSSEILNHPEVIFNGVPVARE